MVKISMLKLLGAEESQERFLYDMAVLYGDISPNGTMQQRDPLNSHDCIWMCVLEIPSEVVGGQENLFMSPFVDGETCNKMYEVKCTLKICQDNFSTKLFRCQTYVLILGKQYKNVSQAFVIVNNAIKKAS